MKILLAVLLCLAMLGMFACAIDEPAQEETAMQEPQRTGPRTVREFARVHESMPEFTFAFTGYGYVYPLTPYCDWPSGFLSVTTIDISSEDGFHQHITLEPIGVSGYIDEFGDLNGDGYLDFWLVAGARVWLWCPQSGKFIENDTLREFAPFGFDWNTSLLSTGTSVVDDMGYHTRYSQSYHYRDGVLTLQRERRTRSSPACTDCRASEELIIEDFERRGNNLELQRKQRTFTPHACPQYDSSVEQTVEFYERMGNNMVLVRRYIQDSRVSRFSGDFDREIQELVNGQLITVQRTRTGQVVEDSRFWEYVEQSQLLDGELVVVFLRRIHRGDEHTLRDIFQQNNHGELFHASRERWHVDTDENGNHREELYGYTNFGGGLVLMTRIYNVIGEEGVGSLRRYERINGQMQLTEQQNSSSWRIIIE
ncbi:MAG: hypothetical protein FWD06_04425 [Oscillospiraceae bacterium]|nr:hypothetical protein [Oscillospiraceae bacterium]